LYSMPLIEDRRCPTMGVDERWRCYYNPDEVDKWSLEEVCAVLLHELFHLMREHAARARSLNAEEPRWGYSADAEINDDIDEIAALGPTGSRVATPWARLPKDCIYPESFGLPRNLLAEVYYHKIKVIKIEIPLPSYGGSGSDGVKRLWELDAHDRKNPGLEDAERKLVIRDMAEKAVAAVAAGTAPGSMARWAQEILKPPKVDWRREVAAVVRGCISHVAGCWDYSYHRPSRRQGAYEPFVAPCMRRPVPEAACVVDDSGSISGEQLDFEVNEVAGILRQLGQPVTVLAVDSVVQSCKRAFGHVDHKLEGGGGTDMGEGIRVAMLQKPRPDIIVVLTDGFTPWPPTPPNAKVIVVICPHGADVGTVPPWAKTIKIEEF